MKFSTKKVIVLLLCSLFLLDVIVSVESMKRRRKQWWNPGSWFGGGNNNSSPNAELYRRLVMGVLQVMYNTQDNSLHQCIPAAGEWGKQLDPHKKTIDDWVPVVGPLVNFVYQYGSGVLRMACMARDAVVNFLQPWFGRRKVFLEGKFSSEKRRFSKVFRKSKIIFLLIFSNYD